jgi:TonB family protein
LHRRVIQIAEQQEATEPHRLTRALERYSCLTERLKQEDETAKIRIRLGEIYRRQEAERQEAERQEAERQPRDNILVQGGVLNGQAISKPAPRYPAAAKQQRVQGTVKVWIVVDEQGRVVEAAPCGHPLLADASVRAAYAARFTPTTLSGHPVKVSGVITYNFVLR